MLILFCSLSQYIDRVIVAYISQNALEQQLFGSYTVNSTTSQPWEAKRQKAEEEAGSFLY